jgi:outer membrane protein assembly factor BamB
MLSKKIIIIISLAVTLSLASSVALWAQPSRNRVANAGKLPASFDLKTSKNIRFKVDLGTLTYAGPTVAGNQVYVGTNNGKPRDPKASDDRGVVMAFNSQDGRFLWQNSHAKLVSGSINDWPDQGVCSTPTVDGERLYYVSNRAELVALDTRGYSDNEDDGAVKSPDKQGADVVWTVDLITKYGVFPHHMAASSPLVVGERVFVHTGHGVGEDGKIGKVNAPSFAAFDKKTGNLLWQSSLPGAGILDGQWSSPSFGNLGGRDQVLFPAGDGWLYSFSPDKGELLWKFDASQHVAAGRMRENLIGSAVIADGKVFIAVGHDPEMGPAPGKLWALAVEAKDGKLAPKVLWSYDQKWSRTLGSVAVDKGLLYAVDLNGLVHCVDVATGKQVWIYDTFAAVWGSVLLADDKVYVIDEDGDLAILAAGREQKVLFEANLGAAAYSSPTAVDGTLYVATVKQLFALAEAPQPAP